MHQQSVIDKIWKANLSAFFFVFVFLLETTLAPTNETPSLDGQTIAKLGFFYTTIAFSVARFTTSVRFNTTTTLLLAYLLTLASSAAWSQFPATTIAYSGIWLAYLLLSLRLVDDGTVAKPLRMFYIALLAICALSLASYVLGLESAIFAEQTSDTVAVRRLKGITGGPNSIGNIAGMLLIISTHYWCSYGQKKLSVFFSLGLALSVLVLSFSRTSILTAAICSFLIYYRKLRHRALKFLIVCSIGCAILFFIAGEKGMLVSSVTKSGDSDEIATLTGRTAIWLEAVKQIQERPILGGGLGSARWIMGGCKFDYGRVYTTAHNFILEEMLEVGIVGTTILILLLMRIFLCLSSQDADPSENTLFLSLFIYLLFIGISERSMASTLSMKSAAFLVIVLYCSLKPADKRISWLNQ